MLPHAFCTETYRLAAPPRAPRPAVAGHARPVPHLAIGGDAAADAGFGGGSLLRALPAPLSRCGGPCRGERGGNARAVERPGLLRPWFTHAPCGAALCAARFFTN